ncbi:MAG TPA: hypothetical protein VIL48_12230 [Acidimicrobiales bacterium]
MADIEIVQPVEGAARVTFDYAAAAGALDALRSMTSRLTAQAEARIGPYDDVVINWAGRYREEFDEAWRQHHYGFTAALETASARAGLIYQAIDDANARQRALNTEAEELALPVPPAR